MITAEEIDAEPGGPWYRLGEVKAMGALCDKYGMVIDPEWRQHPQKELWRRERISRSRYGTMA